MTQAYCDEPVQLSRLRSSFTQMQKQAVVGKCPFTGMQVLQAGL
jgi:hypothetical protein